MRSAWEEEALQLEPGRPGRNQAGRAQVGTTVLSGNEPGSQEQYLNAFQ